MWNIGGEGWRLVAMNTVGPHQLGQLDIPTHGKPRPELWLFTYDTVVPEVYYS
jgi:hypothetical protein